MISKPLMAAVHRRGFSHATWISGAPRVRISFAEKVSQNVERVRASLAKFNLVLRHLLIILISSDVFKLEIQAFSSPN